MKYSFKKYLTKDEISKICIRKCSINEIDDLILKHYLKARPAVNVLCLALFYNEIKAGMMIFSLPPKETEKRYNGKVLELSRLFIENELPTNSESFFIAKGIKYIKKNFPEIDFLISYADPSQEHTGQIYKATNWTQDGKTDDERKSPRWDYYDKKTGKRYGRRGNIPDGIELEKRPRVSKYRFFFKLKG